MHVQKYADATPGWLWGEFRRLKRIAADHDIDHAMRVHRTNIYIGFADDADRDKFRLHAFSDGSGHELWGHGHSFTDDTAPLMDAWQKAAEEELDLWRVRYRVERDGNSLRFHFDDKLTRDELRRAIERGQIDDLMNNGPWAETDDFPWELIEPEPEAP